MTDRDERSRDSFDSTSVPDRLPTLDMGRHGPVEGRMCAMEAAAWLSGEEWTDHPRSVHPVIARVARGANDHAGDADRQTLWPLILDSIGTARSRHPMLAWRLSHCARRTLLQRPDDWRGAWTATLALHATLTGHRPVSVPRGRLERLEQRLHLLGGTAPARRDGEAAPPAPARPAGLTSHRSPGGAGASPPLGT